MDNLQPMSQPKKGHGCFFWGCIISLLALFLAVVVVLLLIWWGIHFARNMVAQYTDSAPMVIQPVELPPDQLKQLHQRLTTFNNAINAHSNTPPLVLTGQEIDALIAENSSIKSNIFVTLDGDKIEGQISLPLDLMSSAPGFKMLHADGRYLNGKGTLTASIAHGDLFVNLQALEVNGKPVPEKIMVNLRRQNLAQGFNQQNNGHPKPFENYESMEVKDNTVIVTPKTN